MSWSIATKTQRKSNIVEAINNLDLTQTGMSEVEPHAADQLETAKRAAIEIVKSIAGPFVNVFMSGHSNGVGWQKKSGYANDMLTVNVHQCCEADLQALERERLGIGEPVNSEGEVIPAADRAAFKAALASEGIGSEVEGFQAALDAGSV